MNRCVDAHCDCFYIHTDHIYLPRPSHSPHPNSQRVVPGLQGGAEEGAGGQRRAKGRGHGRLQPTVRGVLGEWVGGWGGGWVNACAIIHQLNLQPFVSPPSQEHPLVRGGGGLRGRGGGLLADRGERPEGGGGGCGGQGGAAAAGGQRGHGTLDGQLADLTGLTGLGGRMTVDDK